MAGGEWAGLIWAAVLAATGLALSAREGFSFFRRPGKVLRRGTESLRFSREAAATALAGSVGTGNILGVGAALALGGPGALFWMWVSALLGMGIRYWENRLAVSYRVRTAEGPAAGPMYYIRDGLERGGLPLACLFSLLGALAAFGTGCLVQMGAIASAVSEAADTLSLGWRAEPTALFCGLAAALATALAAGTGKRGGVLTWLVPLMAGLYLLGALAVICRHAREVPGALRAVIRGAGRPEALLWGFRRGTLSHEAGLGSAPMAHASGRDPEGEGFLGMLEVFFDTVLVSGATGLMLLTAGGAGAGAGWTGVALSGVMGREGAAVFLTVSLTLFAFSSVLAWSRYGEACIRFLLGEEAVFSYRLVFCLAVLLGPLLPMGRSMAAADALNALMAAPNLAALWLLSRRNAKKKIEKWE